MLQELLSLKFANPWVLWLMVLPVAMAVWQFFRRKKLYAVTPLPSLMPFAKNRKPWRGFVKQSLFVFRIAAAVLMVIVLARPQLQLSEEEIDTEGIDIIIALDASGSMLARDFEPDRLNAAKRQALNFIAGRKNDRIGLVVFAGESYTQCPLTIDHAMLSKLVSEVKDGMVQDGTAIGMGLATSVIRLKDSDAQSKVVILLTDGVNNSGAVDPLTAVEAAVEYGVRVYTIGVGRRGMAPYPVQTPMGLSFQNVEVEIDEELMTEIAERTGGKYFRATNNRALEEIYSKIDELEKTRVQVTRIARKKELFLPFLLAAFALILAEALLRYLVVRQIP